MKKLILSGLFCVAMMAQSVLGPQAVIPFDGSSTYYAVVRTPSGEITFKTVTLGTNVQAVPGSTLDKLVVNALPIKITPNTKAVFLSGIAPTNPIAGFESYWCLSSSAVNGMPIYAVSNTTGGTVYTMMANPAATLDTVGGQTPSVTFNYIPSSPACSNNPAVAFITGSLPTGWVRKDVSFLISLP